jgi:hypothetical protein
MFRNKHRLKRPAGRPTRRLPVTDPVSTSIGDGLRTGRSGWPTDRRHTTKALLTLAAVLGALAVAAPASLGAGEPQGYRFVTDTLGSLGHGMTAVVPGKPTASIQGYRFVSDTLGSLGHGMTSVVVGGPTAPPVSLPTAAAQPSSGFNWADAAIGAGAAVGALLTLLGGSLFVARRQRRLAI